MALGYTRQSIFVDDDVILAEHGNLEFDRLVNVFDTTLGHNHDGTAAGGAFVPVIKDPTAVHDITLTSSGITGSVISDDVSMIMNSAFLVPTQKAAKSYTDAVNANLTTQFDAFTAIPGNHTHVNSDQLIAYGSGDPKTADFTATYGIVYTTRATTDPVNATLETLQIDKVYTISNSVTSTQLVQLLNPTNTITGSKVVPAGTDVIIEPGQTISLIAVTATTLEVI